METRFENKGITLIALIVTIVILIVLTGISVSVIFSEDGIIKQARGTRKITEQNTLLEKIRVEIYDKQMKEIKKLNDNTDYIAYLKEQNIIKEEANVNDQIYYIINAEKFMENPSTGLGNMTKGDIYYILDGELYYMESTENSKKLGDIFEKITIGDSSTGEGDSSTKNYTWIWNTNTNNEVEILGMDFSDYIIDSKSGYYNNALVRLGTKKLKIPATIEGKTVVSIRWSNSTGYPKSSWGNNYYIDDVEIIELPNTITKIYENNNYAENNVYFTNLYGVTGCPLMNKEAASKWITSETWDSE